MDQTLPDYVTTARNDAQKMGQVANEYATASFTIPDELKKVVQEALDYNKDVITNRAQTFSDYQKAPADAGVRFGVDKFSTGPEAGQDNPNFIWNPYERNAATAQYVSNKEVPFMMWNKLLGIREGTTADTVNAGTRAFGAQATAASGRADAARTKYTDALGEFKLLEDYKIEREKMAQSASNNPLSGLIDSIFGDMSYTPTEPKPTKAPSDKLIKSGANIQSSKGQWTYKNGSWVPVAQGSDKAEMIRQFFTPENTAMMIAQDPKNATKYSAMYNMLSKANKNSGSFQDISTALDSLYTKFSSTPYQDRANPLGTAGIELNTFKNTVGVILAKEVEQGRMSDADRAFYLNQLPQPWMTSAQAKAAIDGVKQGLQAKLGGTSGNSNRPPLSSFDY